MRLQVYIRPVLQAATRGQPHLRRISVLTSGPTSHLYAFQIRGCCSAYPARAIELALAGGGADIHLAAFEKFMVVTALL